MVYEVIIKPIVFPDVEEAIIFYNKIADYLAIRFYENLQASLEEIKLHPDNYFYISKPVRRHTIKKFPYSIYDIISDSRDHSDRCWSCQKK